MEVIAFAASRQHTWETILSRHVHSPYFRALANYIKGRRKLIGVYPSHHEIFRALELTPFESIRVVILGQDPYATPGYADGLAFSVPEGASIPLTLRNILSEARGQQTHTCGDLSNWATQGVLLLNAFLTVEKHQPLSHSSIGWGRITDHILRSISQYHEKVVFMLWGEFAQSKRHLIDATKHLILTSSHPSSTFGAQTFLGCGHFQQCNHYLEKNGRSPIRW